MEETKKKSSQASLSTVKCDSTAVNHGRSQKPAIPVGFYDDSLADLKARNVSVQQLAKQQLESEWEAFQEFAAEVEQQSAKEEKIQVEEIKEREAVEKLDNMQYIDRYRVALERAVRLRNGNKENIEKRKLEIVNVGEDDGEAGDVSAVISEYKKHKKSKKEIREDREDSDALDPCDWRSRGIFDTST
ncbi:hypothetical protein PsorP6_017029 [Peronosclerospora sorghi]|uniref:Uncharacterized protein n=1 Tax=Peronosclerospora sorghi TaxID=230839 RepID=A0ACC0WCM7_9STRA|nr:hypothetical protein PsorP6_017029 [Peronosclerospora sorghi]